MIIKVTYWITFGRTWYYKTNGLGAPGAPVPDFVYENLGYCITVDRLMDHIAGRAFVTSQ